MAMKGERRWERRRLGNWASNGRGLGSTQRARKRGTVRGDMRGARDGDKGQRKVKKNKTKKGKLWRI